MIIEILQERCYCHKERAIYGLRDLLLSLEDDVTHHLSLVSTQLPEYDNHDISHSYKMVDNIEKLLSEEQIRTLDIYELFLIYASCLLHDAAMALPTWEFNLLRCCEGQDDFIDLTVPIALAFDGTKPLNETDMKSTIKRHKDVLFNFDEAQKFIFCCDSEESFLSDLAKRAVSYVDYRNGMESLHSLRENNDISAYLKESESIRCSFIRGTHHKRIVDYIYTLQGKFTESLGGTWGKKLAIDLANICRSHGEDFSFAMGLKQERYYNLHGANLSFICSLLRLADILHFSYDRAPLSLFASKQIINSESRRHWKAKLQGVSYDIMQDKKATSIIFNAFCDEPEMWYFLRDYILCIENEIQNFNRFYRENQMPQYYLNIKDNVDVSGIAYNKEIFIPDDDLRFTLDQRKVLDLLMGVNLYKDKYLCLRELYQNSLDACRVMQGFYPDKEGLIEFGLHTDMLGRRFVYCLDNGSGMDRDIIINHFLKIGNSYYTSSAFLRHNINAKNSFHPTSQFGIGVLSCFMLGDVIDITTRRCETNEAIRFIVHGPSERFYYTKPMQEDLDTHLVGHGTLVKIYINDDNLLSDKYPGNDAVLDAILSRNAYKDTFGKDLSKINNELFMVLQSYICLVPDNIKLSIHTNDTVRHLWNTNLTSIEYFNSGISTSNFYHRCLRIEYNDIEYISHFYFPSNQVDNLDIKNIWEKSWDDHAIDEFAIMTFHNFLIDGISVYYGSHDLEYLLSEATYSIRGYLHNYRSKWVFNFKNKLRPHLTVDRTSISKIPNGLLEELKTFCSLIAEKELLFISHYIQDNNINIKSSCASNIWKSYLDDHRWNILNILKACVKNNVSIFLDEYDLMAEEKLMLYDIVTSRKLLFKSPFLRKNLSLSTMSILKMLIYNSDDIVVDENEIIHMKFCKETIPDSWMLDSYYSDYATYYRSVESYGRSYEDFDVVNKFLPLIKCPYADFLVKEDDTLYSHKNVYLSKYKDGERFEQYFTINVLSETPSWFYLPSGNHLAPAEKLNLKHTWGSHQGLNLNINNVFLFVFIAPETPPDDMREIVETYMQSDLVYAEGVKSGWSILFLGDYDHPIMAPGIVKKVELLKCIKPYFWNTYKDIDFYFPDGTHVTKEYIDGLSE